MGRVYNYNLTSKDFDDIDENENEVKEKAYRNVKGHFEVDEGQISNWLFDLGNLDSNETARNLTMALDDYWDDGNNVCYDVNY